MMKKLDTSGAVAIDIRGAKGPNAVTINGVYEPTEELCHGWTVYRKKGDGSKWLEFFVTSNKWYIKATNDRGRARGWMRLAADPPTRPELCKQPCEVWDGNKWTSQPSVSIVTVKQRREEDKKSGAERHALSVPIDIRGATGPSATSINGIYEPTSDVCGGWPVYRKQGDLDKWLEYAVATNEWYVKPTTDRGRAEGWMCLASDPPTRPELSKGTCEVWDGDRWTIQTTVVITVAQSMFKNMLDVELFCATEARTLQAKLNASLQKAAAMLATLAPEKVEEGNQQLDGFLQSTDDRLKQLLALSEELAAAKQQQDASGGSDVGGAGHDSKVSHQQTSLPCPGLEAAMAAQAAIASDSKIRSKLVPRSDCHNSSVGVGSGGSGSDGSINSLVPSNSESDSPTKERTNHQNITETQQSNGTIKVDDILESTTS